MRYPLTIYSDSLVPETAGACARGPVIFIKKKYKDDYGIYRHELLHVIQWFSTLSVHSLLYLFFQKYRLWSEVMCYKEQAKHYKDDRRELFAKFIAEGYNIDISKESALKLLMEE